MRWIMEFFQSVFEAIFGYCRHSSLSRPFTIEGQTYKVCMDCSQQVFYSRDTMLPLSRREVRRLHADQAAADARGGRGGGARAVIVDVDAQLAGQVLQPHGGMGACPAMLEGVG